MIHALLALACLQDAIPAFKEQTIDPDAGTGYAITLADVNADGKTDVVVVSEQPDQVLWYENPTWKRRTVVEKTPRLPVCVQAMDVDGDGKTELLLGADWKPSDTKAGGSVWLLKRPDDLEKPWTPIRLDEEPTMHRFRLVTVGGKKEFACKTLHGRDAKPGEGAGALLYLLKRPADPFTQPWTREVVQNEVHITHNFWPVDLDGDGTDEILLAGLEGIFILKKGADGPWARTKIGEGDPVKRGGGEIKLGRLPGGRKFIATIEPWHGHSAAVYVEPAKAGEAWRRQVLVDNHKGGHALWAADLTGTGADSLVVGFRGVPEGKKEECVVYVFHPKDAAGEAWEKKVLDDKGLGVEDAICGDLDDDGKIDVVGVGRSTKNVKVYWNQRK
jgi:hypothetical protein